MAFLTSYRAEKIYFEKLRSNIDIAKSYIQRGATDEVMSLLQNAVDADGAIMLCYRNLGEVWADLAAQLEKTQKALEDLKVALEEYHDDLNKKIDEINNYLVRLINALDERVTILENESKVKFAYLNYDSVEDVYSIEYNGETADFDALSAALEYPHLLVVIDNDNGSIYYPRSVSDVLIDFHADGVSGSDYVDISVTMTDSDVVTVTEKTVINYTFGAGFNVSNTNEVTPDLTVLQAKLTAGTGIDIDPNTNEISTDFSEVQAKLTAGTGIEISAQNEISSTVKGNFSIKVTEDSSNVLTSDKTYAQIKAAIDAGENITLTLVEYASPDVEKVFKLQDNDETSGSEVLTFVYDEIVNGTSATQTVLTINSADAVSKTDNVLTGGGSSYTAGFGIDIDANNEISVDTNDVQEKLIAGQNITLMPDSTDPTKTVIEASGGGDLLDLPTTGSFSSVASADISFNFGLNDYSAYTSNITFSMNLSQQEIVDLLNKKYAYLYLWQDPSYLIGDVASGSLDYFEAFLKLDIKANINNGPNYNIGSMVGKIVSGENAKPTGFQFSKQLICQSLNMSDFLNRLKNTSGTITSVRISANFMGYFTKNGKAYNPQESDVPSNFFNHKKATLSCL